MRFSDLSASASIFSFGFSAALRTVLWRSWAFLGLLGRPCIPWDLGWWWCRRVTYTETFLKPGTHQTDSELLAVFYALKKHWPLPLTWGRSNFLELDFFPCGWILEFILSLLLLEYRKATTNMPFLEHCKCSVINKSMVSFALNPLKYPDYLKLTLGTGDTAEPGSTCLACKNPVFSPQHYRSNKQITSDNTNHGAYMYSILTT